MAEAISCKYCGNRRAKRACPALNGDICSICCGEQREVTLACPLDCEFLREAHKREKTAGVPPEGFANPDVNITEDFIRAQEELFLYCIYALVQATLRTPEAVDSDVLMSLEASIQTRLTAESGLIYETRAENTVAAAIQRKFSESLKDFEKETVGLESVSAHADSDIFKTLVFLLRIGQQNSNGRPKGRMFIDMLRGMTPDTGVDERAPSIIL